MTLEIRARHLLLTPSLRELCERHRLHSLGRLGDRIRRIQLWIEDVNGPRGGRDTRCRLRLSLRGGGVFTVECLDVRPEAAVAEVFDRARGALLRTVQRERSAPLRRGLRLVFG